MTSDDGSAARLEVCANRRCLHKGRPLSLDYFRKGDVPPDCYTYFKRCSDCRKTTQIPLAAHLPKPSPAKAAHQYCVKCHRLWSLARFPNQGNKICGFCCGTLLYYFTDSF